MWLGNFAAWMNGLIFFSRAGGGAYLPLAGWDVSVWLGYFCSAKGQREFQIHAGLFKRAMRPVAEWRSYTMPTGREPHQTGEPRGLSPSGGKLPAKPHVPRAAPRPMGAEWGAGVTAPSPRAARPVAERR